MPGPELDGFKSATPAQAAALPMLSGRYISAIIASQQSGFDLPPR